LQEVWIESPTTEEGPFQVGINESHPLVIFNSDSRDPCWPHCVSVDKEAHWAKGICCFGQSSSIANVHPGPLHIAVVTRTHIDTHYMPSVIE
jgi:hypothetical protein